MIFVKLLEFWNCCGVVQHNSRSSNNSHVDDKIEQQRWQKQLHRQQATTKFENNVTMNWQ